MIPGVNPRQMQAAMKKLGMSQEDIEAEVVIIHTKDREIIISNPSVAKVKMMGQESFQISGTVEERAKAPEISEEDIKLVMAQAKVSEEKARTALLEAGGDIAQAIVSLE